MSKATLRAGNCGHDTIVEVTSLGGRKLHIRLTSGCEQVQKMNEDLGEIDWAKGVLVRMNESLVYQSASRYLKHTACPVPSAILKAIEIEAGLALAEDVIIKLEK